MELILEELKIVLLSTIWGVILLGALGSILGGFLIFLMKKIISILIVKLKNSFPKSRLLYPLHRAITLGRSIKSIKSNEQNESDFVLFAIRQSIMFLADTMLLFFVFLLTSIVAIFFGLERPILLIFLVSLSILVIYNWLQSGCFSLALISGDTYHAHKKLDKSIPKKYSSTGNKSDKAKA